MSQIRISFPRTCQELSTDAIQGSLLNRMEMLLDFKANSQIPTISVAEGSLPGFAVIVFDCDTKDRDTLFGFFLGIDFLRNNITLLTSPKPT
jgi:hypothetical protein